MVIIILSPVASQGGATRSSGECPEYALSRRLKIQKDPSSFLFHAQKRGAPKGIFPEKGERQEDMVREKIDILGRVVDMEYVPEQVNLGTEFRDEIGKIMDVFSDLGLTDESMEEQLKFLLNYRARQQEAAEAARKAALKARGY